MAPLVRQYDIDNDGVHKEAAGRISEMLRAGRRININDAMMLYGMYAYHVITDARTGDGHGRGPVDVIIASGIRGLLSSEQVMIGVREMTRRIGISVFDGKGRCMAGLVVPDPIDGGAKNDNRRVRV